MSLDLISSYFNKDSSSHPELEDPKKLIIYGTVICPFNCRVLLTLAAKKIDFNFVGIDLMSKPTWYLSMYPAGKVPYLKHGDKTLSESLVIVNYLDDAYPPSSIHHPDPYLKAKGILLIDELFPNVMVPIKCLKDATRSLEAKVEDINSALTALDSIYGRFQNKFLQDDKPLYPDYMIWPFLNMILPICQFLNHPTITSLQSIITINPSLGKYLENVGNNEIAKKVLPSVDLLKSYYEKNY